MRAGVTAIRDAPTMQERLFGESLALLVALREAGILKAGEAPGIVDIGSGAGIPGIPMHIVDPSLALDPDRVARTALRIPRGCDRRAGARRRRRATDARRGGRARPRTARGLRPGRRPRRRAAAGAGRVRAAAAAAGRPAGDARRAAAPATSCTRRRPRSRRSAAAPRSRSRSRCREGAAPQIVVLVRRSGSMPERYPAPPRHPQQAPAGLTGALRPAARPAVPRRPRTSPHRSRRR